MSDKNEWLSNLKKGDKVIVYSGYMGRPVRQVDKVSRTTKTLIFLKNSYGKFRKKSGYIVTEGCSSNMSHLREYTKGDEDIINRENMLNYIKRVMFG